MVCPHDGDCQIDTESLPLDHCEKWVWISRIITATKDEHYGPYSALQFILFAVDELELSKHRF
jgi:hypothetical protein